MNTSYTYLKALEARHEQRMEAYRLDSRAWHLPQEIYDTLVEEYLDEWDVDENLKAQGIDTDNIEDVENKAELDYDNMAINGEYYHNDEWGATGYGEDTELFMETKNYKVISL